MDITTTENSTFKALGIHPRLVSILDKLKLETPTPIQSMAIPEVLKGHDIIGLAQTGTGKTLAFGLPMLELLVKHKKQGLVLVPTRELAVQVEEQLRKVGNPLALKTAVLIGGANMRSQAMALRGNPHVIIATPGRLNDFLEQKAVKLSNVGILVLDEADRMLDMGFLPQINLILKHVPTERQTLLFSATMPDTMKGLCAQYMKSPKTIAASKPGTTAHKINQGVYFISSDKKMSLLYKLIQEEPGSVLVFTKTKHGAKRVTKNLNSLNVPAVEIHGNRTQNQRQTALRSFKKGTHQVMVATDIAARGIDVTGIALVVNYDLPQAAEDYVHRIGRTARAGLEGKAVSFAGSNEKHDIRAIERLTKKPIPVLTIPALAPVSLPQKDQGRPEFNNRARPPRPFHSSDKQSEKKEFAKRDFAPRKPFKSSSRPFGKPRTFSKTGGETPRYKKFFYAK